MKVTTLVENTRPTGERELTAEFGLSLHLDRRGDRILFDSHSGILNMVKAAVRHFPGVPVAAVLGGFHLIGVPGTMAARRSEVEAMGREMLRFEPGVVYTGHCTGSRGYRILEEVMGDVLQPLTTGRVVEC